MGNSTEGAEEENGKRSRPGGTMPLSDTDTLVVVLAGPQTEVVRQILDRHGARGITPAMA